MNLYGLDYSLLDMGFADPALMESLRGSHPMYADRRYRGMEEEEDLIKLSTSLLKNTNINSSPPKHRHDGTSPLPLGMDWSPPPRNWVNVFSSTVGLIDYCSGIYFEIIAGPR